MTCQDLTINIVDETSLVFDIADAVGIEVDMSGDAEQSFDIKDELDISIEVTDTDNVTFEIEGPTFFPFTKLTDTPTDYNDNKGMLVGVNDNEDGLVYKEPEKWEIKTITQTEIDSKSFHLTKSITDNQSVRVFVENVGIKAEVGVDYSLSGTEIYWTGYNFEDLLEVGDKLNVYYY